jgi:hypothetical protein
LVGTKDGVEDGREVGDTEGVSEGERDGDSVIKIATSVTFPTPSTSPWTLRSYKNANSSVDGGL